MRQVSQSVTAVPPVTVPLSVHSEQHVEQDYEWDSIWSLEPRRVAALSYSGVLSIPTEAPWPGHVRVTSGSDLLEYPYG